MGTLHLSYAFSFFILPLPFSTLLSYAPHLQHSTIKQKNQPTAPNDNTSKMGCIPSRPRPRRFDDDGGSFHHGPKYPHVPPGKIPRDCDNCTPVNWRFQQSCGRDCTATRRSNLRPKWNPENHPRRHSWEMYEETPWE